MNWEGRLPQRTISNKSRVGSLGLWARNGDSWLVGPLRKVHRTLREASPGVCKQVSSWYCPRSRNGQESFLSEVLACSQLEVACRLGIPRGGKYRHRLQVWGMLFQICRDVADPIDAQHFDHDGRQVHQPPFGSIITNCDVVRMFQNVHLQNKQTHRTQSLFPRYFKFFLVFLRTTTVLLFSRAGE